MINKIDPKTIFESKIKIPSLGLHPEGPSHFHSLLMEKIEDSNLLELKVIRLLSQIVKTALSQTEPDKDDLFAILSLPFNTNIQSSQSNYLTSVTVINPPQEASKDLQEKQDLEPIIEEASRHYGVDPVLIRAIIRVESDGNPQAVSHAGAQGLMQLMPGTAAEMGVTNPFDPTQNIMGGTRYLRKLLDRYQGNLTLTLAAYNWGMGNLEKRPETLPTETKKYIAKIESLYRPQTESS
jgi:soluble lytic murein transglycosylase-like protein